MKLAIIRGLEALDTFLDGIPGYRRSTSDGDWKWFRHGLWGCTSVGRLTARLDSRWFPPFGYEAGWDVLDEDDSDFYTKDYQLWLELDDDLRRSARLERLRECD